MPVKMLHEETTDAEKLINMIPAGFGDMKFVQQR